MYLKHTSILTANVVSLFRRPLLFFKNEILLFHMEHMKGNEVHKM